MSLPNVGWLIDSRAFDYAHSLADAVKACGGVAAVVSPPDPPYTWDDKGEAFFSEFPQQSCVITHGDIDIVERVLLRNCWSPGAFATQENFRCSNYYAHLGKYLLNADYAMMPFAELPRLKKWVFHNFQRDQSIFVRPDSPLKLFTGTLVRDDAFQKDFEYLGFYEFPVEELVVVSSPKRIVAEWRFVVASNRVIAGSQYMRNSQQAISAEVASSVFEYAQQIASEPFEPDPVWVLDVCQTDDGKLHLLEIGGFSFASLYACDQITVVKEVSKIAAAIHASGFET